MKISSNCNLNDVNDLQKMGWQVDLIEGASKKRRFGKKSENFETFIKFRDEQISKFLNFGLTELLFLSKYVAIFLNFFCSCLTINVIVFVTYVLLIIWSILRSIILNEKRFYLTLNLNFYFYKASF
jgi:hypothetical protein